MAQKVQVLVVDDSPLCRQLIVDALQKDPDLNVVGTAANGQEAFEKVVALKPNVVTMDVDMPVMDGLTATERIMGDHPTPILVLTADPRNIAPELTHRALEVGALALQVKPALDAGPEAWNLAREVKLLSQVRVIRHLRGAKKVPSHAGVPAAPPLEAMGASASSAIGVVVVGASTGGPQVLQRLLGDLPGDFPAPVALVQHINPAFAESLVGWLQASSKLKVQMAKDGDALVPGTVLLAPPQFHLLVARGKVTLKQGEPKDGHLPSASLLLESAAKAYGKRTVGVLLTGMGTDGAEGLRELRRAGALCFAQDEASSAVFGMPRAAIELGAAELVLAPGAIGLEIARRLREAR